MRYSEDRFGVIKLALVDKSVIPRWPEAEFPEQSRTFDCIVQ
jgi:hypothetical protein